jgi:hypothetical protein
MSSPMFNRYSSFSGKQGDTGPQGPAGTSGGNGGVPFYLDISSSTNTLSYTQQIQTSVKTLSTSENSSIDFISALTSPSPISYPLTIPPGFYTLYLYYGVTGGTWKVNYDIYPYNTTTSNPGTSIGTSNTVTVNSTSASPLLLYMTGSSTVLNVSSYNQILLRS